MSKLWTPDQGVAPAPVQMTPAEALNHLFQTVGQLIEQFEIMKKKVNELCNSAVAHQIVSVISKDVLIENKLMTEEQFADKFKTILQEGFEASKAYHEAKIKEEVAASQTTTPEQAASVANTVQPVETSNVIANPWKKD